ncbi:MAG: MFS transporter [Gammaproteobacteria bacterium]
MTTIHPSISSWKVAFLLSYICIASVSAAIITPALPAIEQHYALSHGALEWVISIFLFGYVAGQLLYGPIANRYGRLVALRSGLVINLLGISLCIVATMLNSFALLLVGRLVTALGAASGLACTFMLLNELLPPERARHAMSFAVISFTVGVGIAVTLGGLVTQYIGWQACFWLLLAHGVFMLAGSWSFQETLTQPVALNPRTILVGYGQALKSPTLIVFSLMAGLLSTFTYSYSAAAPVYTQLHLHLTPSQYGYWNLLNTLGMTASGLLGARLMKLYGPKNVLWLGLSLLLPTFISLISLSVSEHATPLWFFITTMFGYLFSGFLFPAASFFASNAITDKASASSMMSFINMGSATVCVIILGYLPLPPIQAFVVVFGAFFIIEVLLVSLLAYSQRTAAVQAGV